MKGRLKRIVASVMAAAVVCALLPAATVEAASPYDNYYGDPWNQAYDPWGAPPPDAVYWDDWKPSPPPEQQWVNWGTKQNGVNNYGFYYNGSYWSWNGKAAYTNQFAAGQYIVFTSCTTAYLRAVTPWGAPTAIIAAGVPYRYRVNDGCVATVSWNNNIVTVSETIVNPSQAKAPASAKKVEETDPSPAASNTQAYYNQVAANKASTDAGNAAFGYAVSTGNYAAVITYNNVVGLSADVLKTLAQYPNMTILVTYTDKYNVSHQIAIRGSQVNLSSGASWYDTATLAAMYGVVR